MQSALIVSCTDKGTSYFTELLTAASIGKIASAVSCNDARKILMERDFDLILINAPLKDETGERFARSAASKGLSQVILVVKAEHFEEVSSVCEEEGVLTIAKPINRELFWSALKFAKSAQNRLRIAHAENVRLMQKIEDIRIVDRAKCVLISYMNMDEKEAHRYIEKQAMDMRSTRRVIAEGILKTYES